MYVSLIVHCLITSDLYRENIRKLIFTEDVQYAINAFRAYPKRSETYLAINYVASRRSMDVNQRRKFVEDFLTGIDYRNLRGTESRLRRARRKICPCRIGESVDPLFSVSLIAPDATPREAKQDDKIPEGKDFTKLAQEKMTNLRPTSWNGMLYAHILHRVLQGRGQSSLPFSERNEKEYLDSIEQLVSDESSDVTSHLYQEALSQIASETLAQCLEGEMPAISEIRNSIEMYRKVLVVREHFYSDVPRWTRPPGKMTVYALFMTLYGLPPGEETDYTDHLKSDSCESFVNALRKEFDQPKYDSWREPSVWYRGTIYHPTFRGRTGFWPYVERSLGQGWKY